MVEHESLRSSASNTHFLDKVLLRKRDRVLAFEKVSRKRKRTSQTQLKASLLAPYTVISAPVIRGNFGLRK